MVIFHCGSLEREVENEREEEEEEAAAAAEEDRTTTKRPFWDFLCVMYQKTKESAVRHAVRYGV